MKATKAWAKNILNGLTHDTNIYRIFSFNRFAQLIRTNKLVLVNPDMWDDPFENFYLKADAYDGKEKVSLENLRKCSFGQCWTINKDTDAMWRIYSPNKDGVRLKTTAGKLFQAVIDQQGIFADFSTYIGRVEYLTRAEIEKVHQQSFFATTLGGQGDGLAKMLLKKREAFKHEAEVRVLASLTTEYLQNYSNGLYPVEIDFGTMFDEICLDPRLDNKAFDLIKNRLTKKTNLPIIQSDLYKFDLKPISLE